MSKTNEQLEMLLDEMQKLQKRFDLSKTVGADYFEPGMMEYLDQSYAEYDRFAGKMLLRFEVKGTKDELRMGRIESVSVGDAVQIVRDYAKRINTNGFFVLDQKGMEIGNLPLGLCNALAPLYDTGRISIEKSSVSFVEPISKRGRYAKQAVLFVELQLEVVKS